MAGLMLLSKYLADADVFAPSCTISVDKRMCKYH